MDLQNWKGCERPSINRLEGRYVVLERLDAAKHGDGLFAASTTEQAQDRFRYLFETAAQSREEFDVWLAKASASADPLFFAVLDKASGRIAGRQALMRIDPLHGVIEIGSILWNEWIARKPPATEALYLFMRHVFDDLGYRRFEWKCHNENEPSKTAALRFGFTFEGVFRQHMVAKGRNRDTAWFSVIDSEWVYLKPAYETWLAPENFEGDGMQKRSLREIIAEQRLV